MNINNVDRRLKPSTTTADVQYHTGNGNHTLLIDRLTALPAELLIRILSLLPTKDAAAACVLSKKMILVLPWITSLDFDDFPTISHCLVQPYGLERFPAFVAFVNSVLQAHQSLYLTKFRLGVGPNRWITRRTNPPLHEFCEIDCFPDLKSTQINAWISFPLTRCGLRELDLCIHVKEEGAVQLPSEIFTCGTLEVLKLDVNLGLDQISAMQSFSFPNLKKLAILSIAFPEDDFVTRLVSSCPLLEDFTLETTWHHTARFISISSSSLRRFSYVVWSDETRMSARDVVLIHAPNLEYLLYADDLALEYSIPSMNCLDKAVICVHAIAMERVFEASGQIVVSLVQFLSNVQHLSLEGECTEELCYDEVKDHLPVFPRLNCLELCYFGEGSLDSVLWAFLNCSPLLQTLVFPVMLASSCLISNPNSGHFDEEDALNRQFSLTDQLVIPSCCRYHLRRIEIQEYKGIKEEIDLIQYFLKCALVLEELVLIRYPYAKADREALETALRNLPRASVTCSIQVVEDETMNLTPLF